MSVKNERHDGTFKEQIVPLILTVVICIILIAILHSVILMLNYLTSTDIHLEIRLRDVLVGITIYLKTSVDFAIFIGNLMTSFRGWKNRIMIECGTALGNAFGTILVLSIWDFFRDIELLLAAMILIAALVLFKLAEEGLEHTHQQTGSIPEWFFAFANRFQLILHKMNSILSKPLDYIMPNISMRPDGNKTLFGLFALSLSIPFILGLDDFAGYVPVFSIVNVYGFGAGVIIGHMILNIFLFVSPERTIKAVKQPVISLLGSVAFVLLGLWGLWEVSKILFFHSN